jgi:hypothetical protein
MLRNYTKKSIKTRLFHMCILFSILQTASFLSIFPESQAKKRKYKRNLIRVEEFKRNMSDKEREYYEPRKRFIDKQSVKPSDDFFYQIDIILRGTAFREHSRWNIKEIRKLEAFLAKADDFQLHRYFGTNEELYLGMKASKAIKSIKREAKQDENWRKKNDPIFLHYLKNEATKEERVFYKKNKALFFKPETGYQLIQFLKAKTEESNR